MPTRLTALLALCTLALTGCEFAPRTGPKKSAISENAVITIESEDEKLEQTPYIVVDVTDQIIKKLMLRPVLAESSLNWPDATKPKAIKIAVGDSIQVTIYEAQSGGLFVPREAGVRPGNFITLPAQTVDSFGYITVPYVGLVRASGKTPNSVSKSISAGLKDRAIEPQVVVSFANRGGSEVTVLGEVSTPSRFSLNFNDEKILDAIANAGGSNFPGYETWVTLHRAKKEYTIKLDELLLNPHKNIHLLPNDTLYLYREPETFTIYGESQLQGLFDFSRRHIQLDDALARAQALNTFRSNPSAVYLYRLEDKTILETLADEAPHLWDHNLTLQEQIPVIYRFNLNQGDGFFLAQKFPIEHKDTIYVASAAAFEFSKFLNILNLQTTTVRNVSDAVQQ